jgi:hypothetical protein
VRAGVDVQRMGMHARKVDPNKCFDVWLYCGACLGMLLPHRCVQQLCSPVCCAADGQCRSGPQ